MRGKNKCKILKQIRQKIAEENDIPLITKECTFQGECSGTCPRCEAELRYLEQQLARRQALGKTVTVAALSVGLMAGAAGCSHEVVELVGDVPYMEESTETVEELDGVIACDPSEDETVVVELDGDVAYEDETTVGAPPAPPDWNEDPFTFVVPEDFDLEDLVMGAAPVDPESTESDPGYPGSDNGYNDWGNPNG